MGPRLALAALALGVSLLAYALFWAPTEEEKIRAVLDDLERAVRTGEETSRNAIVRSSALRGAFGEIFEKDVSYRIPELTTGKSGREQLVEFATRATLSMTTFDVDFTDIGVELNRDETGARVTTVTELQAFRGAERYEQGDRKVTFDFSKADGSWKISTFRVSPPLAEAQEAEEAEGAEQGE